MQWISARTIEDVKHLDSRSQDGLTEEAAQQISVISQSSWNEILNCVLGHAESCSNRGEELYWPITPIRSIFFSYSRLQLHTRVKYLCKDYSSKLNSLPYIYIYIYIPIKNMEGGLNRKQAASAFICLQIGMVIGGASHWILCSQSMLCIPKIHLWDDTSSHMDCSQRSPLFA